MRLRSTDTTVQHLEERQLERSLSVYPPSSGGGIDGSDAPAEQWRHDLCKLYDAAMHELSLEPADALTQVNTGAFPKFHTDVRELVTGRPVEAARGLLPVLRVEERELAPRLADPVSAIHAEIGAAGTEEDQRILRYVLHEAAGSDPTRFPNGQMDEGRRGERFADFVAHPFARLASLDEGHVLALRMYSTAFYKSLNTPQRDRERTAPHPFPVTMVKLSDGIKRLRALEAVAAQDGGTHGAASAVTRCVDLFRGMRDLTVPRAFREAGGTELAPMSTTHELKVALRYSASRGHRLVFKLRTESFMERGADISFLSAFPLEKECLYPPLVYLQPTGREEVVDVGDAEAGVAACTVLEVKVAFPS